MNTNENDMAGSTAPSDPGTSNPGTENLETENPEIENPGAADGRSALSRLLVGVLAPVATLALMAGPIVIGWSDLPDPMAVGWNGDGSPESSASPLTFLLLQSAAGLLCAALFASGGFRKFKLPIYNGSAAVVAAAIAPSLALVSVSTVLLNRGEATWTSVAEPGALWIAATIGAPMVAIVAVGWLMRETFLTSPKPVGPAPTAGLSIAESESAAWHSQASSRWPWVAAAPLVIIGFGMIVAGAVTLGMAAVVIGLGCILVALIALAFTSILVSVDRRGLTVRYGPLPWPSSHVDLTSIDTVNSIDVKPMEHGGWGYRGSRKLFGKAAVVIRGGDGIHLGLKNGTEFVVTVDNADQGAGVLNDLRSAAV